MIDNRERIRRASRRLRYLLLVVFYSMPVINALVWLSMNSFPEDIYSNMLPHYVIMPLPVYTRILGFLVVMIPTGVAMAGLHYLMNLFKLYEKGEIFQPANVLCFRNLSWVLIWWFLAGVIHRSLLTLAITLHNPPGQRRISLDLSSADLTALLIGGVLAVIAWVMEEGRKLQEDQDLIV